MNCGVVVTNNVAHCEESRDFLDELEGLRNGVLDWEIVVHDDCQAVVVALVKLAASRIARDQAITRLTTLLARYAEPVA